MGHPVPHVSDTFRSAPGRPPWRRLALVVGIWIALAGGALLVANALDSPAGEGAPDKAQPAVPGPIAETTTAGGAAPAGAAGLPPFAMVLDHRLPASVANLVPARQAQELQTLAMATRDPKRFVELGSVLQVVGDLASAEFAYRSALKLGPGNMAARVGLAVVSGGSGAGGLAVAARRLNVLAADHPRDQLVRFNQAWVEIYRQRAAAAEVQLKRVVALGPDTRLGRTAAALLAALAKIALGANP